MRFSCSSPMLFGWVCMTGLLLVIDQLVIDQFRPSESGLWRLPLFALWINLSSFLPSE